MKEKKYTNLFKEYGYAEEEIEVRRQNIWYELFEGPDKFFFEIEQEMGYVVDTGNNDVRTEGMSYAMMLAVQYDRKDIFDKLWRWVKEYMYMDKGIHAHYFAWSVDPSGEKNAFGPAPDGEEFFAAALFFAGNRWGNGEGIFDYHQEAKDLLSYCIHKGTRYTGYPMWNNENKLIKFIAEAEFTDPSYHCPHFYELFSLFANEEDCAFWKEAAESSRNYLKLAINKDTGLNPEYAEYDGSPKLNSEHPHFYSDAYRTALNVAIDTEWFQRDEVLANRLSRLQKFFSEGSGHEMNQVYTVSGEKLNQDTLHPVGLLATIASASIVNPQDQYAKEWVEKFWNQPLRKGSRRYYDNFLYAFSFLILSGNYRVFV